jgi:hypothetical protein
MIAIMGPVEQLQQRVNAALRADRATHRTFSEYRDSASDLVDRLWAAASNGGAAAALDEFDRLRGSEDPTRLRYALMELIAHHPDVSNIGLRIPSIEERAPWTVLPSKRED